MRSIAALQNVCFWHKANITIVLNDVRFRGKADIDWTSRNVCTQSGHLVLRIVASQNDVQPPLCRDQVVGRCPVNLCNGHADAPTRNGIKVLEARLRSQDVFPTVG
jgi:hypothetical protein